MSRYDCFKQTSLQECRRRIRLVIGHYDHDNGYDDVGFDGDDDGGVGEDNNDDDHWGVDNWCDDDDDDDDDDNKRILMIMTAMFIGRWWLL